jgi:hypothetical protein
MSLYLKSKEKKEKTNRLFASILLLCVQIHCR